jgi:hypothetical protein
MAITASDIKFYLSGGASNTVPDNALGGVISSTEVVDNSLHNLFDKTLGTESTAGDIEYRCIYIKNTHASLELELSKVFISTNTTTPSDIITIALAGEGQDVTAETVANENTAPVGETFSNPTSYATGLSLDDGGTGLPAGSSHAIWVKRNVAAGQVAVDNVTFILSVQGDTAA